jgi:hypothetical protein
VLIGRNPKRPAPFPNNPDAAIETGLPQVCERRLCRLGDEDADLLAQLSHEGHRRGLTVLDMSAGQIPDIGMPASGCGPMTQQDFASIDKKTCHNVMDLIGPSLSHPS